MKFITTAAATFTILTTLSSVTAEDLQVAHLYFLGRDSRPLYDLAVLADGTPVPSNRSMAIRYIDAPDYAAYALCHFDWDLPTPSSPAPDVQSTIAPDGRTGRLEIVPATGIKSVHCKGFCVGTLGVCNGADGQGPRLCCNGYCAADRCRPWDHI